MIELLAGLGAAIMALLALWRRSANQLKNERKRADAAEAAVDAVSAANDAVAAQQQRENEEDEDVKKAIDKRRYFGD